MKFHRGMTPIAWNAVSMRKYGWNRFHIGLPPTATDQDIVERVKEIQREHNILVDGKVGSVTYRRIQADREMAVEDSQSARGSLLVGGVPKSTTFHAVCVGPHSKWSLIKESDYTPRDKNPTQVVWHWDASLSAKSCHRILAARDVSSHGCIDNDGTFYQFLDLKHHAAWHAGHRAVNRASIGIDISNAVSLKYQKHYQRKHGKRPVIKATVNGHEYTLLGYYQSQLDRVRDLAKFFEEEFGIPRVWPGHHNTIANPEDFKGHLAHYHVKKTKWDTAGLPFDYVLGKTDDPKQGD